MNFLYNVYILLDSVNNIIAINSDAFLKNTNGWIKIDEGTGEKYHHAQTQYLKKTLISDEKYNYKFINNKIVETNN